MPRLEGRPILALAAAAVALVVAIVLVGYGTGEAGVRAAIRWTARSSLAIFLPTFAASALHTLRPRPATKWLLRNRRQLGLSFAISHFTHLALIVTLAVRHGYAIGGQTIAIGAYVLLLAMTLTSNDAALKWLGRRRWRALHLTGMYVLAFVFAFTYGGISLEQPAFAPLFAAVIAAWGLRIAAWRKRRVRVGLRDGVRNSYRAANE